MAGRFSIEAVFKAVDRMTAPINKMQSRVSKLTRSMSKDSAVFEKIGSGITTGFKTAAIAGIAALGFVGVALQQLGDKADDLQTRAARLKFPIEGLQEWGFVASQVNIRTEDFDTMLDKFSKTLGAAKMGTGSLTTALKGQNPALLRQLRVTKDGAQAFEMYLDFLRKIPDVHKRNALAAAAFGKTGDKMNNIVNLSTKELAALRLEARQNGFLTGANASALDALADKFASLKTAASMLIAEALIPLVPALTDIVESTRAWINENKKFVVKDIEDFIKFVRENKDEILKWGKAIAYTTATFVVLIGVLNTLITVLTVVNLLMVANPITLMVLGFVALAAAVVFAVTMFDEFADSWLNLSTRFGLFGNVLQILLSPVMGLIVALKLLWEIGSAIVSGLLGDWQPLADFWEGLVGTIKHIPKILGFGGSDSADNSPTDSAGSSGNAPAVQATPRQMVTPQERQARMIDETRTTSTAELLIRDETGRGVLTRDNQRNGPSVIDMIQTGNF